jgi:glycosyltransferase involved in cell wall biosynthesis
MRIILVIQRLDVGGAERQIIELAQGLKLLGHQVSICCLNERGILAEEAEARGIAVVCLDKAFRFDLRVVYKLAAHIKRLRADVVQTYLYGANLWGTLAGRLAGVPVLVTSDRSGGWYQRKIELVTDQLLRTMTDALITNTNAGRHRVQRYAKVAADKIHVIYNGMNWQRFENRADGSSIRNEFGLKADSFVVVISGTMRYVKNCEMFVETAHHLLRGGERYQFVVVGGGPMIPVMQSLAATYGIAPAISFTGVRHDIPRVLAMANVGVLCSYWEGFSNSIMEYMAAGLPVVATDVGGNRDLVANGVTGFLVRSGDIPQMAEKIRWLATDERMARSMGDAGRNWIRENCDFQILARRTEAVYSGLLQRKGRRS